MAKKNIAKEEKEKIPNKKELEHRRNPVCGESFHPESSSFRPPFHSKSPETFDRLTQSTKLILLFQTLDFKQLKTVVDAMYKRSVKKGDVIIKQGDDGDNFYIIESGQFEAFIDGKSVTFYDNTGCFGELALMYNVPRSATVVAVTDGILWVLDRITFQNIVVRSSFLKRNLYQNMINKVPMLSSLNDAEKLDLADALVPKTYEDGEVIVQKGDIPDGMYFVEEGEVVVKTMDENVQPVIFRLKEGDYFGEVALIATQKRIASVQAVGNVKLAFLNIEAFERLLGPCMDFMKKQIESYSNGNRNPKV